MSPDISVIVLNWNGRAFLEPCLGAVLAQQGADFEVILVDNASTDGTPDFVRERFPTARLLVLPRNVGFAAGNNAGASAAKAPLLAFLNNDTVPDPNWLARLRAGIRPQAGFAVATSRIVYMHDPGVIDSAGDGLLRWGAAFKRHHGASVSVALTSEEVFGACGAAFMLPKDVFEELGGFDEAFFASHEDVDLSYRARLRGYRCWYAADAVVRHHGSATLGKASPMSVFYGQRNLEWMYVKNTPAALLWKTLPGHLLYNAAAAGYFVRRGLLGAFVRGKAAALAGLPRVIEQRRRIQRTRRVDVAEIEPLLQRRWLSLKRDEKRFDTGLATGTR